MDEKGHFHAKLPGLFQDLGAIQAMAEERVLVKRYPLARVLDCMKVQPPMVPSRLLAILSVLATTLAIQAQVIEFESNGLNYQTLTKGGVTIMYAPLPTHIKDYSIIQIAVSNGSPISWTLRPEDFAFERSDGEIVPGSTAKSVVIRLMQSGGRNDVIKLVQTYEMSIYGLTRFKSTNGYEQRRQAAFGAVSSTKLKAAAAASAVAFSATKLPAGQSTDGAVFFEHSGKGLGAGRLVVKAGGEVFRFDLQGDHGQHHTQ